MKPPAMFECPSCAKRHYLVYCVSGPDEATCDEPYISVYYPSPKDSICPRHRYPDDPEKQEIEWEKVLRCPTTSEVIAIEDLFKAKARKTQTSGVDLVVPEVSFAPEADKEELPATGVARCPTCKILIDLSQSRVCPRCGKTPAPKAMVEEVRKKEADQERRREKLYDIAIRKREKIFGVMAGVVLALLVPLGLTESTVLTILFLLAVIALLGAGIGLEFVFLRIVDIPFYKTRWEEEIQRRKGKPWWEARQRIASVILRRPVGGADSEGDSLDLADDVEEDFRWLWGEGPEPGKEAGVSAEPAGVGPPAVPGAVPGAPSHEPMRRAEAAPSSPSLDTRAYEEPDEEEIPHLDGLVSAGLREEAAGAGPAPGPVRPPAVRAEASPVATGVGIRFPAEPKGLGRVRYLGGHPGLGKKASGRLDASPKGLSFTSTAGHIEARPDEILGVRIGFGTWPIALGLALVLAYLLFRVPVSLANVPPFPSWDPFPKLENAMVVGRSLGLAASGIRVLLCLLLLSGLVLGPHQRLRVRLRSWEEGEGEREVVASFAVPLLSSLRVRRVLGA